MSVDFRRRVGRAALWASLPVVMLGMVEGCGSRGASAPPRTSAPSGLSDADKATLAEASDEREAQRVWCEYLEALYRRAATGEPAAWPSLGECLVARTMASPEMLRRTAACSRAALDAFDGDPFTREYAKAVSKCGAQALDAVEASVTEIVPFVSTICGRMAKCGDVTYAECKDGLGAGIGPHLERAVGAMNRRGREALGVCLRGLECGDLGSQVVGCLQPIMDGLLWLPG